MTQPVINVRTKQDWTSLLGDVPKNIRFAYLLDIQNTTDSANTDSLSMNVDMRGEWDAGINGTDYKYGYPDKSTINVRLFTNGDFKINYYGA